MSTNRSILIEANKGENTFKFWSFVLNRENGIGRGRAVRRKFYVFCLSHSVSYTHLTLPTTPYV